MRSCLVHIRTRSHQKQLPCFNRIQLAKSTNTPLINVPDGIVLKGSILGQNYFKNSKTKSLVLTQTCGFHEFQVPIENENLWDIRSIFLSAFPPPPPPIYRVIETRVEVWENEKYCGNTSRAQGSVSTASSSSPKLSRVFL